MPFQYAVPDWKEPHDIDQLSFAITYGSTPTVGISPDWLYRESLQEPDVVKAYLLSSVRKRIARLYERDQNDLPPRQKEASFLRYNQGLGVEEIAEMVDVHYQSAKNLLHRGLLTLRKEWKGSFLIIALLSSGIFKFI